MTDDLDIPKDILDKMGELQEFCDQSFGEDNVFIGCGQAIDGWILRAQSSSKDCLDKIPDTFQSCRVLKRGLAFPLNE